MKMLTKEQETCGQIVEALNSFAEGLKRAIPDEAERDDALSALYEVRHNLIHLGNAIGEMRAPIGLDKDQREAVAFLLELASEVTSDTLESMKLDNARRALAPLLEAPKPDPNQLAFGGKAGE
jgi:hypothetical protein